MIKKKMLKNINLIVKIYIYINRLGYNVTKLLKRVINEYV